MARGLLYTYADLSRLPEREVLDREVLDREVLEREVRE